MVTYRMNAEGQYVPKGFRPGIEIRARDVDYLGTFEAQHLYIIFTFSNGEKYIIRGGPKNDQMLTDDLYITGASYKKQFEHLFPNDFSEDPNSYRSQPIPGSESFTDAQIQHYLDTMSLLAAYINAQMYDYKLPFGENVQNSNTVVKFLIERAGLPFVLPKDKNGNEVWAPGVDGKFGHTQLDNAIKNLLNIPDFVIRDHALLSAALGLESLFDTMQRERTASAHNAESYANNFGRGNMPPSAVC